MRIDLRYLIVAALFYVPGTMLLLGAWALGYSTSEAREAVAFAGVFLGFFISFAVGAALFIEGRPIWWHIGKGGGE
jgi:hypothetical protein